jgi:hypothetical protein
MTSLLTAARGRVMARVVILGAGISGHTAALHLRRLLGKGHEVVVVSPNADWNWIPSNIWVGVGRMSPEEVTFPLAPVYRRQGIEFHQARAVAIWPEGDTGSGQPAVNIVSTPPRSRGRAGAAGLRLPDQRHRTEAELRRHPGAGTGRELAVGVHARARGAGGTGARRGDREAPGRAAADPGGRGGARDVHLRGRGVRVHVQRRA